MGDTNHFKHGEMNIDVQEKTFAGFVTFSKLFVACALIFLVLLAMFNG